MDKYVIKNFIFIIIVLVLTFGIPPSIFAGQVSGGYNPAENGNNLDPDKVDETASAFGDESKIPYQMLPSKTALHTRIKLFPVYQDETGETGGWKAGLKALFFGPRIGIEANENVPVTFIEKANLFVPLSPFQAYTESGVKGFMASAFLGPRVGMELKERKIRKKEWYGLIPALAVTFHLGTSSPSTGAVIGEVVLAAFLSRIFSALDAYHGRTMSDIELTENLRR